MTKPHEPCDCPCFRTEPPTRYKPARVWIICSYCGCDIRQLQATEAIHVTRAYFCPEHDDGTIHLNPPRRDE